MFRGVAPLLVSADTPRPSAASIGKCTSFRSGVHASYGAIVGRLHGRAIRLKFQRRVRAVADQPRVGVFHFGARALETNDGDRSVMRSRTLALQGVGALTGVHPQKGSPNDTLF